MNGEERLAVLACISVHDAPGVNKIFGNDSVQCPLRARRVSTNYDLVIIMSFIMARVYI